MFNGDLCRCGACQRIQDHEVVNGAVVADIGDGDVGVNELAGIGFSFVSEDVIFDGDNEGGREALELLRGCLERREVG